MNKAGVNIFRSNSFLAFSHRGGAGLFPENTLYAFRQSVTRYDANALELDIHMSRDGELVVIHDDTVDRTTDGSGRVSEKTLSELKSLDAGYSFTKDGGKTFPFRGRGLTIPSLSEVFTHLADSKAGINIDIKRPYPNIEQKLYRLIMQFNMSDRVLVNSGHPSVMKRFRSINKKGICTGADSLDSFCALIKSRLRLYNRYSTAAEALQLPLRFKGTIKVVTGEMAELCRKKKLKLHVWTINEIEEMKRLMEMGVDGIMTDYPDRLHRLLSADIGRQP